MATLKVRDPETGEVLYVDEDTLQEVSAPQQMMVPPSPLPTPIPPVREEMPAMESNDLPVDQASQIPLTRDEIIRAALMSGVKGATFNLADEAQALIDPEGAAEARALYQRYQEQHPYLSMGGEILGGMGTGGAILGAGKALGKTAARAAAPYLTSLGEFFVNPSLKSQALQGAVAGAGAGDGNLENQVMGAVMGGTLGTAGGIAGRAAGAAAGKAGEVVESAVSPTMQNLTEAEKAVAKSYLADPSRLEQGLQTTMGNLESPMTLAERTGKENFLLLPEKETAEMLTEREAGRIGRQREAVQSTMGLAPATGFEYLQSAKQTAQQTAKEASKRKFKAGQKLYTPLESEPKMAGGQTFRMQDLSVEALEREERAAERKLKASINKIKKQYGQEAADRLENASTAGGARTKQINKYQNANELKSQFARLEQAQKTKPIRGELKKLNTYLDTPTVKKVMDQVYAADPKGVPNLRSMSLREMKLKVLGKLKEEAQRVSKIEKRGGVPDIPSNNIRAIATQIDQRLAKIFPAMKAADEQFAKVKIPEAYGGMSEVARTTLQDLAFIDPQDVQQIGQILNDIDPKYVKEVLEGSKNIGQNDMPEALKKGYKAYLDEQLSTATSETLQREFLTKGTRQKQILDALVGEDQANKFVETLGEERAMGTVERRALYNSPTGAIREGSKQLEQAATRSNSNIIQKALRVISGRGQNAATVLDELISIVPEIKDERIKKEILRIYRTKGLDAVQKMQKLQPAVRKLERMQRTQESLIKMGGTLGGAAGRAGTSNFMGGSKR